MLEDVEGGMVDLQKNGFQIKIIEVQRKKHYSYKKKTFKRQGKTIRKTLFHFLLF